MPFKKGQKPGPGRPKGLKNSFSLTEFMDAIREVEIEKGKPFYKHVIERAYDNDKVLCFVVNKIVPEVPRADESPEWVKELLEINEKVSDEEKTRFQAYLN